jgi:hypothetical protein
VQSQMHGLERLNAGSENATALAVVQGA